MAKNVNPYQELEDRTATFAKQIAKLCQQLPYNIINKKYIEQIIRSSGSIGANYREANEAISRKDFLHRLRISRKEAKETSYWLDLLLEMNPSFSPSITILIQESRELRNILSAILHKSNVSAHG